MGTSMTGMTNNGPQQGRKKSQWATNWPQQGHNEA